MRLRSVFLVLLWLAEAAIVYCPETDTRNQDEHVCRLSDDIVGKMFDSVEATWTVDDAFLAAHQLQDVLDCAKNGETVALNISQTYVPDKSLVIRTQITIRPSQALEATVKATLTCPPNDALILTESASVVLENLIIKNCRFHSHFLFKSIVKLKCNRKEGQVFVLSLLDVEFWNNRNAGGSTGISIENPECVSVTMKNATFRNNDLVSNSTWMHKNNLKTTLALWRAPDTLLELNPSRDLKEEEETIIVTTSLFEAGNFSLVLRVSDVSNDDITLNVAVQNCLIDEFLQEDTKQCIKCKADTYNFYLMNETCKKCPKDADCSGEYVLPHHGHWNSFPCFTHVQECLNRDACRGLEKSEVKRTILVNDTATCDLSEDEIKKYRDAQCDKGYQGVLCGSCKKDHGRIELNDCVPCQNWVLIAIVMFVSACLLFYSAWEQIAANLKLIKTQWMQRLKRPTPEEREANVQLALQMTAHFEEYIEKAQKAKEKFAIVMQITLNFMQAMVGCLSICREWSSFLPKLLTASNLISLNVSQVYNFSFECLLPSHGDMPRSVLSTILALFVPLMVIGIFWIYWLYDTLRLRKPWKHFVKRCVLSFVSVLYVCSFSLLTMSGSSMSCHKVFESVSLNVQGVSHSYWVGDTSVRCAKGSHAVLRYWIAFPIAYGVSSYLLVVLLVLYVARNRNALQSEWIHDTLGVLFIGFRSRYAWWDSLIQMRKFFLVTIVITAYNQDNLWIRDFTTCCLVFFMVVQLVTRPYRIDLDTLNFLERNSHIVCLFTTFISTILAYELVSSAIIKATLVSIVVVAYAVSVTVYGYQLVTNKFVEIKYTLLLKGVVNEDDKIIVVLLKSWKENLKGIKKFLGKFTTIICSRFDRYRFESDETISASLVPSSSNN